MMAKHKKKHKMSLAQSSCELNVMPFIDIFSLLCTFLLFSAVFISIGVIEVQVPFLTNAAPSKSNDDQKKQKFLDLTLSVSTSKIELTTKWDAEEDKKDSYTFSNNAAGLKELHAKLLESKKTDPKTDKITIFIDDDVSYDNTIQILDHIKIKDLSSKKSPAKDSKENINNDEGLYPKIIFGSVIL